jgi:hypothetical protein
VAETRNTEKNGEVFETNPWWVVEENKSKPSEARKRARAQLTLKDGGQPWGGRNQFHDMGQTKYRLRQEGLLINSRPSVLKFNRMSKAHSIHCKQITLILFLWLASEAEQKRADTQA